MKMTEEPQKLSQCSV